MTSKQVQPVLGGLVGVTTVGTCLDSIQAGLTACVGRPKGGHVLVFLPTAFFSTALD